MAAGRRGCSAKWLKQLLGPTGAGAALMRQVAYSKKEALCYFSTPCPRCLDIFSLWGWDDECPSGNSIGRRFFLGKMAAKAAKCFLR